MSSKYTYISPLCSCIVCKQNFSQKSIHTHYIRTHTNISKRNTHKGTQKFQLKCSCIICKLEISTQNLSRHIDNHTKLYESKLCPKCNSTHSKDGIFCSRKCANSRKKQKIIKVKYTIKIKSRICKCCKKEEFTKGRFQSEFCKFCNPSTIYRNFCTFTFDLRKYPNEFDLSLLERYGMFNPKTNPTGISRDHLLSIHFGKINNIDPKILSHPANCKLVLQSENSKKNSSSDISLEELLNRIQIWEIKYP